MIVLYILSPTGQDFLEATGVLLLFFIVASHFCTICLENGNAQT